MPRSTTRIPKYRLHKPSGQAVVTLDGRDVYLGKHGSPESKAEYNRLVAEWQLHGCGTTRHTPSGECTIDELIIAYLRHAEIDYVKDGKSTGTQTRTSQMMPRHEMTAIQCVDDPWSLMDWPPFRGREPVTTGLETWRL